MIQIRTGEARKTIKRKNLNGDKMIRSSMLSILTQIVWNLTVISLTLTETKSQPRKNSKLQSHWITKLTTEQKKVFLPLESTNRRMKKWELRVLSSLRCVDLMGMCKINVLMISKEKKRWKTKNKLMPKDLPRKMTKNSKKLNNSRKQWNLIKNEIWSKLNI